MQKVNVEQIGTNAEGSLAAVDGGVVVTPAAEGAVTEPSGKFDAVSGQLTISLPNMGTFVISGLPKTSDMGSGPAGADGSRGRDGIAGLNPRDGQRGPDGCIGADGQEGMPGKDGPRGREGDPGGPGPEGKQGEAGQDGRFAVYMQSTDPGPVGAGSVWIRPRAKATR